MFGALKFRQISALCTCCKLHSITRRTFRFAGAYLLGFLIVTISCDILANTTGHLKPYFAHECHNAYRSCAMFNQPANFQARNPTSSSMNSSTTSALVMPSKSTVSPMLETTLDKIPQPASPPISSAPNSGTINNGTINSSTINSSNSSEGTIDNSTTNIQPIPSPSALVARASPIESNPLIPQQSSFFQRQWIDLSGQKISDVCDPDGLIADPESKYHIRQLAMSWPSYPASMLTYAALFIAFYLSYVGTARPFRIITCIVVMSLLLAVTVFDAKLVDDHFSHWEDVAGGAVLALVVVIFILLVYLNRFRDSHYYEDQKLSSKRRQMFIGDNLRSHNSDHAFHGADKPDHQSSAINIPNADTNGSVSNNDLAMRYFQIPRANYRGAPRPVSTMNQML